MSITNKKNKIYKDIGKEIEAGDESTVSESDFFNSTINGAIVFRINYGNFQKVLDFVESLNGLLIFKKVGLPNDKLWIISKKEWSEGKYDD